MGDKLSWHTRAVEQLSQIFDNEPDARALVLCGSLADAEVQEDVWSDVDAKIILVDHALDDYYLSTAWLYPLGRLIGAERHHNPLTRTLRLFLEGFRHFDLTFIAESALHDPALWDRNPFYPAYVVIWSKIPDLETYITSLPIPAEYQEVPCAELEKMVDAFWFKACVAIAKVVRNDLLIGMHLALDLMRDSLVLQMKRRDREKRTTIHRVGGWGNDLVARFSWTGQQSSGEEILNLIRLSCEIFDELAPEIIPSYNQRGPLLFPSIEAARKICHREERSNAAISRHQ